MQRHYHNGSGHTRRETVPVEGQLVSDLKMGTRPWLNPKFDKSNHGFQIYATPSTEKPGSSTDCTTDRASPELLLTYQNKINKK